MIYAEVYSVLTRAQEDSQALIDQEVHFNNVSEDVEGVAPPRYSFQK